MKLINWSNLYIQFKILLCVSYVSTFMLPRVSYINNNCIEVCEKEIKKFLGQCFHDNNPFQVYN